MTPAARYAAASPVARGIFCMIVGTLLLTTQDGIAKWLTTDYHAGEIMFYRGIFAFPMLIWFAMREGGLHTLRSRRPRLNGWRSILAFVCSIFVVLSFSVMPLADALAIIFLSPILLTALSAPMLGEQVGWRRWLAVLVGFTGVLLMTRPGEGGFTLVILFPLAAALTAALRDISTRQLGGLDSATTVLFWTMVVAVIGGALTLPFGTRWPTAFDWLLFASSGILVTLSHWLTIKALHFASGAIVGPFKYLSLVWAAAIGYVVWGDVPEPVKVVGAAVVVASGLYILRRETRRPKPVARAT